MVLFVELVVRIATATAMVVVPSDELTVSAPAAALVWVTARRQPHR